MTRPPTPDEKRHLLRPIRLTVTVSKEEHEAIRTLSAKLGCGISQTLREVIFNHVELTPRGN